MKNICNEDTLYFNNRLIKITKLFPTFNIATVKYIDNNQEFTVDINFLTHEVSQEYYITIKI